jgi:metal-sulfur cluster biosynthetic enzyme
LIVAIDSNLAKVDEVMTALYDIQDPEIGMSIVDLDLIKAVDIGAEGTGTEIKMVLTTPFCPWAGELIQTVKTKAEEVVGPPVKVTLLAERWEPPPGLF